MVAKVRHLIDWASAFVVFITIALWAGPNLGTWFGRVLPAAAPMELTEAVALGDTVVFGGTSARLLPWCSPRELRWRLGSRGAQNAPIAVNWGPAKVRDNGAFSFSGWIAEIDSVETFRFGTYGDVLHKCTVLGIDLPFLVRSRFWN